MDIYGHADKEGMDLAHSSSRVFTTEDGMMLLAEHDTHPMHSPDAKLREYREMQRARY
jgi:hypothetical protein